MGLASARTARPPSSTHFIPTHSRLFSSKRSLVTPNLKGELSRPAVICHHHRLKPLTFIYRLCLALSLSSVCTPTPRTPPLHGQSPRLQPLPRSHIFTTTLTIPSAHLFFVPCDPSLQSFKRSQTGRTWVAETPSNQTSMLTLPSNAGLLAYPLLRCAALSLAALCITAALAPFSRGLDALVTIFAQLLIPSPVSLVTPDHLDRLDLLQSTLFLSCFAHYTTYASYFHHHSCNYNAIAIASAFLSIPHLAISQ